MLSLKALERALDQAGQVGHAAGAATATAPAGARPRGERVEVFGLTLTAGSPAKITVMRVKWKPEAQAPKARPRVYTLRRHPGGCRPNRLKSFRRRDRCIVAHERCMPAWQTAMPRGPPFRLVAERRGRINQQVGAAPWPSHPNLEQQAAECFEGACCVLRPWTCCRVFGKRSWVTRASRRSTR